MVHRDPGSGCRARASERTTFVPRVGNYPDVRGRASLPIAALNVSGCKLAHSVPWPCCPALVQGRSAGYGRRNRGSVVPPHRPALPTTVPGPAAPRPRPTFDARHGGDVAPGSTTRAVAGRPETRDGGQTTPGSARRSTSAGGSRSRGGVGGARGRFGARLPPALRGRLRSAGPGLWFPSDPGGGSVGPKSPRSRERRVKSSRRRGRRPCAIASGSARRAHFSPAPASL